MIEQIARRSSASISLPLRRYTRSLTVLWCSYFVGAAILCAAGGWWGRFSGTGISFAIAAGSVLLFVGEHWLRPRIFPHEPFPGLLQQFRDTWSIWRSRTSASAEARQ